MVPKNINIDISKAIGDQGYNGAANMPRENQIRKDAPHWQYTIMV